MPERETVGRHESFEMAEEHRRLTEKHHRCEERLTELRGRLLLTESEKLEEVNLKKQKLLLKDRMEAIARGLRASDPAKSG